MNKTKSVLLVIACLLIVGLVAVFQNQEPASTQVQATPELPDSSAALPHPEVDQVSESMDLEAAPAEELLAESEVPENIPLAATIMEQEALVQLLPSWMHEEGVDFYTEKAEVMGETVTRCRGRYLWDDGAQMEYELTDVGPTLNLELLKGLGFNFDLENAESESGYTSAYELEPGVLLNHEYDEVSGEGSLQVLVDGRFLLEVQLEGFEAEAFEDVLENHLPLDELLRLL